MKCSANENFARIQHDAQALWRKKFSSGIIRANNNLYEFSDRDIVRYKVLLGKRQLDASKMNRKFLETCENFRPTLIIKGGFNSMPLRL